ncbi:MAG: extracellular, partial [Abditibacteriota bacterium]|nr:extracellular [Abditibacteriota bacterium]
MTLNPHLHQFSDGRAHGEVVEASNDASAAGVAETTTAPNDALSIAVPEIATPGTTTLEVANEVEPAVAPTQSTSNEAALETRASHERAANERAANEFGVDAEIDRLGLSHPEIGQAPLLPPREPIGARIASFMGRHHTLLFVLSVVILWAITTLPPLWHEEPYERGEVASHDILAPHSQMLFDRQETLDRQERAATLVPPSYDPDASAQDRALSRLRLLIDSARSATSSAAVLSASSASGSLSSRTNAAHNAAQSTSGAALAPNAGDDARVRGVARQLNSVLSEPLSPTTVRHVLSIRRTRWSEVERAARAAIGAVYVGGQLRSDVGDDLLSARARIDASLRNSNLTRGLSEAEIAVATAFAQRVAQWPNLIVNDLKTERARQAARKNV